MNEEKAVRPMRVCHPTTSSTVGSIIIHGLEKCLAKAGFFACGRNLDRKEKQNVVPGNDSLKKYLKIIHQIPCHLL